MNFNCIKLGILAFISFNGAALYGMMPKFEIHVTNQVLGRVYNNSLQVGTTSKNDVTTYTVVGPNVTKQIGTSTNLKEDSKITIGADGALISTNIKSLEVSLQDLKEAWRQVKQQDSDHLFITVTAVGDSWTTYKLVINYSRDARTTARAQRSHNPLDEFPGIKDHKLETYITAAQIAVIPKQDWNKVIVPGLVRSTTAEDIFRYVLGLRKNYTKADVKKAHADLTLKNHPDKNRRAADETYQNEVTKILHTAREGLLQALDDQEAANAQTAPAATTTTTNAATTSTAATSSTETAVVVKK